MGGNFDDVMKADTDSFVELVALAGLSPAEDFRNVNLEGISFGTADLRKYRFEGSILDGADLSAALLSSETLKGASTVGARLPLPVTRFERTKEKLTISERNIRLLKEHFPNPREAILSIIRLLKDAGIEQLIRITVNRRSSPTDQSDSEVNINFKLSNTTVDYANRLCINSEMAVSDLAETCIAIASYAAELASAAPAAGQWHASIATINQKFFVDASVSRGVVHLSSRRV